MWNMHESRLLNERRKSEGIKMDRSSRTNALMAGWVVIFIGYLWTATCIALFGASFFARTRACSPPWIDSGSHFLFLPMLLVLTVFALTAGFWYVFLSGMELFRHCEWPTESGRNRPVSSLLRLALALLVFVWALSGCGLAVWYLLGGAYFC